MKVQISNSKQDVKELKITGLVVHTIQKELSNKQRLDTQLDKKALTLKIPKFEITFHWIVYNLLVHDSFFMPKLLFSFLMKLKLSP